MAPRNRKDPHIDFAEDRDDYQEDPTAPRRGPVEPFVEPQDLQVNPNLLRAMKGSCPGHLMAVVCRVTSVKQVGSDDAGDNLGYDHCIYLQDLEHGRDLVPYPTSDLDLIDKADAYCREGTLVVAYGRFVSEPGSRRGRRTMQFELHHLRPARLVSELLGATRAEREKARAKIDELSARPGALAQYIESELADMYGIDLVNVPARFRRMVRLVLLQAVSDGNALPGSNPRLGLCFLSEPGQGKGVLARIALALSPSMVEVQPTLVTMAGFSVQVQQRKGQSWVMKPGAMPRASKGVCVVHDIHRLPARELKSYHGVMLSVGEEGRFLPTKASDTPVWAEVGLHLNGNHAHVMDGKPCPKGPRARLIDLGLPLDLFSRIDVVVALCLGEQIDKLAQELAKKATPKRDAETEERLKKREREMKVLVAELRDSIADVDLGPVEGKIDEAVEEVNVVMREHAAALRGVDEAVFQPTALSLRTARGLRKMTVASARLDGRTTANAGDVLIAQSMAAFKLEVVKWVCGEDRAVMPLGQFDQQYQRALVMQEARKQQMMETFGGLGPVDAEQVAEALGAGRRTVERDLKQMGVAPVGGRYDVPTVLEHEKRKEEAELRGQKLLPAADVDTEAQAAAELARTVPHKFRDTLPDVPAAAKPALRILAEGGQDKLALIVKALIAYALYKEVDVVKYHQARAVTRYVESDAPEMPRESADAIVRGLQEEDWEKRAGFALALYTSTALLPTYYDVLEEALERLEDAPLGVRRHIESAIERRRFIDENRGIKLVI